MNHRIKGRKLSRNSAHRKALFRNLAISLITYGRIKTTLPKAKDLRPYIEKIVTIAKSDNLANRRLVYSILGNNHAAIERLFKVIGPKVINRNGGYTRILKYGFRTGDKAPMSLIEFVDNVRVIKEVTKTKIKGDIDKAIDKKDNKKEKDEVNLDSSKSESVEKVDDAKKAESSQS